MLPYLVVFILSIFFAHLAQISDIQKNKILFFTFSFISIIIPALLSGFRDIGIGTDTLGYVNDIYLLFRKVDNWSDFYVMYQKGLLGSTEIGFLLVAFISRLIFNSLSGFYFIANFIVILLFYMSSYKNRHKAEMWLSMAFFYFLFYNQSLNLMRQAIAIAMTVYAFQYIETKNIKKIILWSIIIISFHSTGFVYPIIFLINYITTIKNSTIRYLMSITIPLILIISISYLDSLIIIFIGIGILPGKFLIYLSEESNNTIVKSLTLFYCIAIIFYIYSYYYSKDRIQQQETNRYLFIKINGLILSLVSLISQWGIRVSYYVNALDCILLPRIIRSYKNDKVKYLLFNIAIIILLVIIWYSSVVVNNSGQTYPYKSEILDQFL